ncbi:hypothetical protein [Pseudomonas sp. MWU12-2323]|uniref:hypothetical protein n=1 Tax=Pseudomonas sp. MWU12-2323 TaxID=2651296 RepID=UPI00128AEA93|nr:hypothetical protein [Pseudomonas sp. MWU12-2323]MPQ69499.1 hypothetical protein [Pseudomonas sp. MWU12-2323]
MKVMRLKMSGTVFLLPETHGDYEFPNYILQHQEQISEFVTASMVYARNPLALESPVMSDMLKAFRARTGIIGYPFSLHDVDLYAMDPGRNVEIVAEAEL